MLARVQSAAVVGIEAAPIDIEVDFAVGLPGCHIVGLPDAGVREGRVRIRSALDNCGFKLPPRRITVNLAPADLRKDGAAFDLPIALGMLAAAGAVPVESLEESVFVGELALDGAVRPVKGVLPVAAWARRHAARRLFVPAENAEEASLVQGTCAIVAVRSLGEVVTHLLGNAPNLARAEEGPQEEILQAETAETCGPLSLAVDHVPGPHVPGPYCEADMADVRGQEVARRALEIAAAGGHNLVFVGPPGSGKTMLARRLPGILPPPSFEEALETTTIYSIAGLLRGRSFLRERPFRAPHHTVSVAGLVGGGPQPRPGEITLAHNGVLFLDELLEFQRPVLESLRQPLEERCVSIVRARKTISFPSDFALVAALNPCPCGHFGSSLRTCTCSLAGMQAYRARLSGPLLDRIDMHVEVPALAYRALAEGEAGEASSVVRTRVIEARQRQLARGKGALSNARLSPRDLGRHAGLDERSHRLLEQALKRYGLSARALGRIRRVARTIADLAGAPRIEAVHLAEALQYRFLDRPLD